jgi:heptosyltransferase-2
MQSPTIALLKKQYPHSFLTTWLAPRSTKQITQCLPAIDHVIEAPIKQSIANHLHLTKKLRRLNFSTGLVMSPGQLIKSAAYLFLSGASQRIGHQYPLFNKKQCRLFLTQAINEDPALHDIEQNLNLLKPLNIPLPKQPVTYSLNLSPKSEQEADLIFNELGIKDPKKIIGLHPGSSPDHIWKRWPSQNFIALGRHLAQKTNAHILIFGGPQEEKIKQAIAQSLGPSHASPISSDLLTSATLIKKCNLFISNDSGLMHVAAALKVPTLGLFGPTNENQTGPRGKICFTLRAPHTSPTYHTEKNYRLGSKPHPDIKALQVNQVLAKIKSIDF